MKLWKIVFLSASFLFANTLQAKEWELIRLDYVNDGTVDSSVRLFSNNVTPGSMASTDTYRLEIDGQDVDLPFDFIRNLNMVYRDEIAYDLKTHGIGAAQVSQSCPGFDPSKYGKELSVRYLKFIDGLDAFDLTNHQMRKVFTEGNCHYEAAGVVYPNAIRSRIEAAKLTAVLDNIKSMVEMGRY